MITKRIVWIIICLHSISYGSKAPENISDSWKPYLMNLGLVAATAGGAYGAAMYLQNPHNSSNIDVGDFNRRLLCSGAAMIKDSFKAALFSPAIFYMSLLAHELGHWAFMPRGSRIIINCNLANIQESVFEIGPFIVGQWTPSTMHFAVPPQFFKERPRKDAIPYNNAGLKNLPNLHVLTMLKNNRLNYYYSQAHILTGPVSGSLCAALCARAIEPYSYFAAIFGMYMVGFHISNLAPIAFPLPKKDNRNNFVITDGGNSIILSRFKHDKIPYKLNSIKDNCSCKQGKSCEYVLGTKEPEDDEDIYNINANYDSQLFGYNNGQLPFWALSLGISSFIVPMLYITGTLLTQK